MLPNLPSQGLMTIMHNYLQYYLLKITIFAKIGACSTSMGFILWTGAMVSIKNYCGIGITATHMSNIQSAYFSVCGILWPSKLRKQPSNKQALIYLLTNEMVWPGTHKKSSSCRCWRCWCFPVANSPCRYWWLMCIWSLLIELSALPPSLSLLKTDVFQLLVHHADPTASNVYMVAVKRTVCATTIKRRVDV